MEAEEAEKRLKDYILNGIVTEILWAEEAYALAQEIGKRADAIRAAGFGSLFGSLQVLASDRQTLSVAKMFDRPQGRYPTRSIPATLAFLKAHADSWRVPERHVLHQTLIDAGVERKAVELLTKAELTRAIVSHHESELAALTPALADLRRSRDKIIAHNEAIERSGVNNPVLRSFHCFVRPYHRAKAQARRCPNLRGPTRRRWQLPATTPLPRGAEGSRAYATKVPVRGEETRKCR